MKFGFSALGKDFAVCDNNTKQGGDLWSLAKKVGDPKTSKHYSGMVRSIEDLAAPEGPNKRWRFGQVGVLLLLCATLT